MQLKTLAIKDDSEIPLARKVKRQLVPGAVHNKQLNQP
jgi:hypothetical protein